MFVLLDKQNHIFELFCSDLTVDYQREMRGLFPTSGCLKTSFLPGLSTKRSLLLLSRVHMSRFSTRLSWSSSIRSVNTKVS